MMEYGLVGRDVSNSYSKLIHEYLQDYTYQLYSVDEHQFVTFMKNRDFKAINITIPYKVKALKYVDELDPLATKIKSINTVVNYDNHLVGYNSDYDGFKKMLKLNRIPIKGQKIVLIGNGGAALSIKAVLKDLEAKSITIVTANPHHDTIQVSQLYQDHCDAQIIINSSPCGMYPNDQEVPLDLTMFKSLCGVVDIVYHPFKTQLIIEAINRKLPYACGLDMLIAQAIKAIEYFKSIRLPDSAFVETYQKIMDNEENIVLIGMPSCGKTTIGKQLAKQYNKEFVDLDQLIEKTQKLSIANIFKQYGEAHFRELESECVQRVSQLTSCVIATGGGTIIKQNNADALKRNGYIVWIKRTLDLLEIDSTRPLSFSKKAIEKLAKERYALYDKCCDYIYDNDSTQENAISHIYTSFTNSHLRR